MSTGCRLHIRLQRLRKVDDEILKLRRPDSQPPGCDVPVLRTPTYLGQAPLNGFRPPLRRARFMSPRIKLIPPPERPDLEVRLCRATKTSSAPDGNLAVAQMWLRDGEIAMIQRWRVEDEREAVVRVAQVVVRLLGSGLDQDDGRLARQVGEAAC
jgi:hypothetical protein